MPTCCSPFERATEQQFNSKRAGEELARYRDKGPGPTTRSLLDGIRQLAPPGNGLLLDVGSGIGSLAFELLKNGGVSRAVGVDASPAYIDAAVEEAQRRGCANLIEFVQGDFVAIAGRLPRATIVTMDRVVCCYPSFEALLSTALEHAERCVALSYPRDVWYVRAALMLENAGRLLHRNPFRTFVHSAAHMRELIAHAGFHLVSRRETWVWCSDVYLRRNA